MKFKILIGLFLFFALVPHGWAQATVTKNAPLNQTTGPIVQGLQFMVSLDKHFYSVTDPIYLDVAMENVTDNPLPLLYPFHNMQAAMNYSVLTLDGNPVPFTAYGKVRHTNVDYHAKYILPAARSYSMPVVPSHGALKYHILISRLFDLSNGGHFQIIVKQLIPTLDGKGQAVLTSEPLEFQVNDGGPFMTQPFITNPTP